MRHLSAEKSLYYHCENHGIFIVIELLCYTENIQFKKDNILYYWIIFMLFLSSSIEANVISINVDEYGSIANDGGDDSLAFQNALNQLNDGDVLIIPSGEYQICKTLHLKQKDNITILGLKNSKLKKCRSFNGEYLLHITYLQNFKMQGLSFEGVNDGDAQPVWGEQGIYLGSTTNSLINQNNFTHFGDAALRVTTASEDHSSITGSRSNTITQNRFEYCAQVTTTQAASGTEMPGTQDIVLDNNVFNACKLKLSARSATTGAKVISNRFENINGTANEISYYSDVYYSNNTFDNIKGFAINIYPNDRTNKNVQWGNVSIINNNFNSIQQGIRLQSHSHNNPNNQPIKNINISGNTFSNIYFGSEIEKKYKYVIRTQSQDNLVSFSQIYIYGNEFQLTADSSPISIDSKSSMIYMENNIKM